jgi:hypothetical protein
LVNEIFLDEDPGTGIHIGQRWREALNRAATRCEGVVCLISTQWESSEWCRWEYSYAADLGKRMFVALLQPDVGADPEMLEWQQCALFGDGPKTTVDIGDGKPVVFETKGLLQLREGIRRSGIGSDSFEWPIDDPERAPYRGWQPFEPEDAGIFCGRDAQILRAMDALRNMRKAKTKQWFVILGPSGTGKSSFLRAGLVPRMQRDDREFLVLDIVRPERDVLGGTHGLATAIYAARQAKNLTEPPLEDIEVACIEDPAEVRRFLIELQHVAQSQFLGVGDNESPPTIVLPLDQAEELLSSDGARAAEQFLRLMRELESPSHGGRLDVIVAATIRSDRFGGLQARPELADTGIDVFGELGPMPTERFAEVIVGPAERVTADGRPLEFAADLLDQLLADCKEGSDTLPLLALTLSRLYENHRASKTLTLAHYEQIGRLRGVVQSVIDGILDDNPSKRRGQLDLLRDAFVPWLATVNDDGQWMRRVARWEDLPEGSRILIEAFVASRLLVKGRLDNEDVVEVALESLLRQWDDLAGWLDGERDNLKTADDVKRLASSWEASGRDDSWLLSGTRLAVAQAISARPGFDELLAEAGSFLDASRQHEDELLEAQKQTPAGPGAGAQAWPARERFRLARFITAVRKWFRLARFITAVRKWFRLARSITAIVGADSDALSMAYAIAMTLAKERRSRLVVIVDHSDAERLRGLRDVGALVVASDIDRPGALAALSIWRKLDCLYLLAADPATNVRRLQTISQLISGKARKPKPSKRRLRLIVRIDDPWQAESWRARQLGGSDTRWGAEAVGIYEVTAARLLDRIVGLYGHIGRLLICGTSPLTFALCGNLARKRIERDYYTPPDAPALPNVTLVDVAADEYRADLDHHQSQAGHGSTDEWLHTVNAFPSLQALALTVEHGDGLAGSTAAVIFTQAAGDVMLGARLATRFPELPIFVLDSAASEVHQTAPALGRLHTYRLGMDVPSSDGFDVWERAAILIHERFAAQVRAAGHESETTKPWAELNESHRGSIRRQVHNALWMVETIAGHTWDTFGDVTDRAASVDSADPGERLAALGFDRQTAMAMAKAEHEDWLRYYREWGWRYGPERDHARKVSPNLVDWNTLVERNPAAVDIALDNVATTLHAVRALGFRSRPAWQRYQRTGILTATRHIKPWTWTTASGEKMRARAGDWEVSDGDGSSWSVRDKIFRSGYEHIDGNRWRRTGYYRARPARDGEMIDTLEGPSVATGLTWVVEGTHGERWVVAPDVFAREYEGVESA